LGRGAWARDHETTPQSAHHGTSDTTPAHALHGLVIMRFGVSDLI
jgi:hypothetical protein